jgi:hypothetical protein
MHPPDEILWGDAPGPGPALRSQVEQTTQEANRAIPGLGFFALCLIGLGIFIALGMIRLLLFGPWWKPARSAAPGSGVAPIHRQALPARQNSRQPKQAKPQTPQPSESPR